MGVASALLDAVNEYNKHPHDSRSIAGDTGAVEGKLFLAGVAPWLAIAALVIDPALHAMGHVGIMDTAGESGRAAVEDLIREVPKDRDAVIWLLRFASQNAIANGQKGPVTNLVGKSRQAAIANPNRTRSATESQLASNDSAKSSGDTSDGGDTLAKALTQNWKSDPSYAKDGRIPERK